MESKINLNDLSNLDKYSAEGLESILSDLEKKKNFLDSFEDEFRKQRAEIEPLDYLKYLLKILSVEKKTKNIELEPSTNDLTPKSQNTCIPEKNKTDSTSLHDDNEITTKAPLTSEDKNSFINSDVFIELIEKFGVVTVDELLKEMDIHEPSSSRTDNIGLVAQGMQTIANRYFEAKSNNVQLKSDIIETNDNESIEQTVSSLKIDSQRACKSETNINSSKQRDGIDGIRNSFETSGPQQCDQTVSSLKIDSENASKKNNII